MRNVAKYVVGAVIALSVSAAAAPAPSMKSDSSCYDAYGYYGYSAAYCDHDMYGRSSPADRYYGQNRDLAAQDRQQFGQEPEREQYSSLYRGFTRPNPDDHKPSPDRDRDRG